MSTISIFFDGACDPNPGRSGYGWVCYEGCKEVSHGLGYLGVGTNNTAEYHGLLQALIFCEENKLQNAKIYGDSLLVINQMNNKWKVKSNNLKILNEKCKDIQKKTNACISWVPRANNSRADELSKVAIPPQLKRENE